MTTQQLLQFITRHWALVLALLVILILLLIDELFRQRQSNRMSPQQATNLINREHATVIDLRERDAYLAAHIINAVNLTLADVRDKPEKLKKYQGKPILLVCNAGQNSQLLSARLQKQGLTKVYVLSGGIQAWKNAGLPLTKN